MRSKCVLRKRRRSVASYAAFPSDSDALVGDELSRVVTWNGRSDLSELKGRPVSIRIHMARARLYSLFI